MFLQMNDLKVLCPTPHHGASEAAASDRRPSRLYQSPAKDLFPKIAPARLLVFVGAGGVFGDQLRDFVALLDQFGDEPAGAVCLVLDRAETPGNGSCIRASGRTGSTGKVQI